MHTRQLAAYILIVLVLLSLSATYWYLTRQRRAQKRAWKRSQERRRTDAKTAP